MLRLAIACSSQHSLTSLCCRSPISHPRISSHVFLLFQPSRRCRNLSNYAYSTKIEATNKSILPQNVKWKILARITYYLRIPFLVLSVYGIGYQQGIMDYSSDPTKMESKLLDTTLAGVGCVTPEDREKVLIAHEGEWRTLLARFRSHQLEIGTDSLGHEGEYQRVVMLRNVAIVGEKIVKVAQAYVKQKLKDVVEEAAQDLPQEVLENEAMLYHALEQMEDVQLWTKARKHMQGPWKYVLIPSSLPNAFVSEILPHRIFITTSLLQHFISSQDELALVLGHEISHLILSHSSAQNSLETSFRTIEILLLSLDPTEGVLSLAFMSFLASLRGIIAASYSRENERSADELGIKLTAMACYNTREASHVFRKMHLHNIESGLEYSSSSVGWGGLLSFFDSHPPSEERFEKLLEDSKSENAEKYEDSSCASLKTLFWEALRPNAEGSMEQYEQAVRTNKDNI